MKENVKYMTKVADGCMSILLVAKNGEYMEICRIKMLRDQQMIEDAALAEEVIAALKKRISKSFPNNN